MGVDPASQAANATTVRPLRRRFGVVTAFDAAAGLGTVIGDDDTEYQMQSIELSDATRSVEPGTPVSFVPLARFGRFEAGAVICHHC